ncbi:restriction endonuclease subunit S [Tropicimonas isoalkanivorans]|uniref:Type I restriction enzyme, S subunit n=1 Tax=Tropicimonas isoalkanivorans TaxID=441112 RepID=A0A1I1MXD4_9RHOB|nr:restriction endonuclease subunit S [Tropicimonas isoalkanivorans]SFC90057.1 type I restriction enzyme, S subunit [Tropicimonas isoalkanivorans]
MLKAAEECSPERGGYKETKIGLLPTGWDVVSLEEITEPSAPIRYGVVQIGPVTPGGVPIVPIKHIRRIGDVVLHRASPKIEGQYMGSRVQGGDVLLSVKGTIGEVGVVPDGFKGNIAREIARIRPKPCCDAQFLSLQIQAPQTQRRIDNLVVGSTRLEFSIHAVRDFMVALPPLPEQRKIAEILRTWDEALEKLTNLRAAKARRFEGLRDKLIAAASRTGHPALFGDFLTESREPGTDGATARKISVRLYGKGAVEKVDVRGGSANTRYYRRSAGQLIWSKLDFLNGAFALLGPELDGCESTLDLPAFDCSDAVNPIWLIEYLTRPAYYTRQIHLARGQRKARRVSPEDWLASPVRRPDRTTQDKIAGALSTGRTELALLDAEIGALTRQKRGLMQKLLTGEWRVKLEAPVA